MSPQPPQQRRRRKADLVNLRSLPFEEPITSTGRVLWIWEEIQAGLASGKKAKEIWKAAQLDGLNIPYSHFRVYVSRLRRRERRDRGQRALSAVDPQTAAPTADDGAVRHAYPSDPFHNLRAQREKKQQSGFEYDPFSIRKDLVG